VAKVSVTVNGELREAEAEPRMLLIHFLRDVLRLTGSHVGCVVGRCGACTVLWRGKPVKSCMVYAVQTDGTEIVTVEGLARDGRLNPLQQAFWDCDAAECGYCTPGMLMSGYGLLLANPSPTDADIKRAISGNLCRCTGYLNIVNAIRSAAQGMAEEREPSAAEV
jgi:aerobic carbon-monoxide dehydrogenase small subunit